MLHIDVFSLLVGLIYNRSPASQAFEVNGASERRCDERESGGDAGQRSLECFRERGVRNSSRVEAATSREADPSS